MREQKIGFTKKDLFDLLKHYFNCLIEDGTIPDEDPITAKYEHQAIFLNDYVDGYFKAFFESKQKDTNL